ncbi:hypothetical protein EYF80_024954 [Liparis tanakae]|uniref:Uncharacterized protein n=1 Tax=Liparis tanakae TaxID=230148 RepID=A0A4Z2HIU7_9TELE|nr:hypothetical protein EYF80_024954 [Liparis tanakae]
MWKTQQRQTTGPRKLRGSRRVTCPSFERCLPTTPVDMESKGEEAEAPGSLLRLLRVTPSSRGYSVHADTPTVSPLSLPSTCHRLQFYGLHGCDITADLTVITQFIAPQSDPCMTSTRGAASSQEEQQQPGSRNMIRLHKSTEILPSFWQFSTECALKEREAAGGNLSHPMGRE